MVTLLSTSLNVAHKGISHDRQHQILREALQSMGGDPPSSIPFLLWLLENPDSPIALPGKIDLYRHDCLHLLLDRGFSLYDEAFVVGFTMGNDVQTQKNSNFILMAALIEPILILKFFQVLYQSNYPLLVLDRLKKSVEEPHLHDNFL